MIGSAVLTVFFSAMVTALATGIGALPLLFMKNVSRRWLGLGNSVAAGLMLAISFSLVQEAIEYSMWRTIAGMLLGLLLVVVSRHFASGEGEDARIGKLKGAHAREALLIVAIMTIHSFAEGVGVGVSFGGGENFGWFISMAIAVHNIPEGLAISLVLVPKGVSVWKSGFWSVFSSLPQPIMAVPAFLFVEAFRPVLPVGLGFAAGAMIWMVFSELIEDAIEDAPAREVAVGVTLAVIAMIIFQTLLRTSSGA